MPESPPLTLQELVTLGLPPDARVLAGKNSLQHPIGWIISASMDDLCARGSAGDFAFLLPPYANDDEAFWEQMAQCEIAGCAVIGDIPADMVRGAERVGAPLIALPRGTDLRRLERAALSLLLDRTTVMEQRAGNLYARLTVLSAENAGLEAMVALIGATTGKTVLLQDKRLALLAASFMPEDKARREFLENWARDAANLPEELRDRKRAANFSGAQRQAVGDSDERLVAPVVVKNVARGFLSLVAPAAALGAFDARMLERGASACALEMAKVKAVREVEKKMRGDFVDAILAGTLAGGEAARWISRDQFPNTGAYAALSLGWASGKSPTLRRLETIVSGELRGKGVRAYAHAREEEIIIFIALDPTRGIEPAQKLALRIQRLAASEFPDARLATGVGKIARELSALRESYREAQQARSIAARLAETAPLYFGDLNVYRLLFKLEDSPELAAFCHETLGALIEYDRAQKSNLLETLAAYFAHHGNLTQTAAALHVHRNSLHYRMARIGEIGKSDLDNSETRLALQLALRAYRILEGREEKRGG
ncbi:MAG: helix-turn-helix domain-containing protein [Chloroflexi bacterium]|nr:helix-turn-helix domain-containing protein [Chloroflexota bacterium]